MDDKSPCELALDQIEAKLTETPTNQTWLEGFSAGAYVAQAIERSTGRNHERALDTYQVFVQVMRAIGKNSAV